MSANFGKIRQFLLALDKKLKAPVELYLIGGAAITLAYDHANRTTDLDLIDPPDVIERYGGVGSELAKKFHVYTSSLAAINFAAPPDWKENCRALRMQFRHIDLKITRASQSKHQGVANSRLPQQCHLVVRSGVWENA